MMNSAVMMDDLEDRHLPGKHHELVEQQKQQQQQQQQQSSSTVDEFHHYHRLHHDMHNKNQQEEKSFSVANSNEKSDETFLHHHNNIQYRNHHEHGHDWVVEEEPAVVASATTVVASDSDDDATQTVYENHRKLLYLLSHPKLFVDAMIWQSRIDRGLDPVSDILVANNDDGEIMKIGDHNCNNFNGIQSFEEEFQNDVSSSCSAEEIGDSTHNNMQTDDCENDSKPTTRNPLTACTVARSDDRGNSGKDANKMNHGLLPPLPLQIFASNATVVLPQALTASQLFGIECTSGIELEVSSSTSTVSNTTTNIYSICKAFLRWLALMPGGDHTHPAPAAYGYGFGYGVGSTPTVMKISDGRYRVVGAHRVVWRWMNKFSFPGPELPLTRCNNGETESECEQEGSADGTSITMMTKKDSTEEWKRNLGENSVRMTSTNNTTSAQSDKVVTTSSSAGKTDFDFGDLVSMTIIDVFETDVDGKLLSYCPTFDNRAVHKTQEVREILGKGVHIMEELVVMQSRRHGVGKSGGSIQVAGDLGKKGISAALAVGNIFKKRIEEEIQKHR